MTGPFKTAAKDYLDAGWSPLPLPPRKKFPPPAGYTGATGVDVTAEDIDRWCTTMEGFKGRGNIAVRMPSMVVGIDVDAYDDKNGHVTLATHEAEYGLLPRTWSSTSRHGTSSRIMFFIVPEGKVWKSDLGPGVEIIQHGHRYAVVGPSIHPDMGVAYGWYDPDGRASEVPPSIADLGILPEPWVRHLYEYEAADRPESADLTDEETLAWLDGLPVGSGDEGYCGTLAGVLRDVGEQLTTGEARHDIGLRGVMRVVGYGEAGHKGVSAALYKLREIWEEAFGDVGRQPGVGEWERMLAGAVRRVLGGDLTDEKHCCGLASAQDDFDELDDTPVRDWTLDVTNPAETLGVVYRTIGRENTPLAGLFRRGAEMVYTARIGQTGYRAPEGRNHDGPAQIRAMDSVSLCSYIDKRYIVNKQAKRGVFVRALFPREVAVRATAAPELLDCLRELRSVSHTPFVRADGSVCRDPGYDDASQTLYLPDRGLVVPEEHRGLPLILDELLEGFPFETAHDRMNYLAALLTPLMRRLAPPPYPMFAFNARQPGSGKSLLAGILRELHGGVFRAEMVRDKDELEKQIASILYSTSAPVVTFDNMSGTLKSPVLDAMLASDTVSVRVLGSTREIQMDNDRVWTITGNNVALGGDLKRRTIWVSIDPNTPHPERRTNFKHPDLLKWVRANRGEIIAALLGMVQDWVEAGSPRAERADERTDSFGPWQAVAAGVLEHTGLEGTLNAEESVRAGGLEDEDEWSVFVRAVERVFGDEPWFVRDVFNRVSEFDEGGINVEELPHDVALKYSRDPHVASLSLGKWVQNRAGRWTDDNRAVREAGIKKGTKLWRVVSAVPDSDLL